MARIYVSSTFNDLKEYRNKVSIALRRLGHEDVAMEYYVAEDKPPMERCLSDVESCDLYIGVFAFRYGYVPKENNPKQRSITELEYRKAQDESIPCLIFLMSEEAPWPRSKQDKGLSAEQIESLRQELQSNERHVVNFFENADELTRKVNEAVIKWEKESGLTGKRQLTDWDAYREVVRNKHQWVRLQVIAGASKERGITKIPLSEVFEPQLTALGFSRRDVPDEVRKYQEAIYGDKLEASNEEVLAEPQEPEHPGVTFELETEKSIGFSNPELVLDMLGREPTQVILGGPGMGKSTILHYAILQVCQAEVGRSKAPLHLQQTTIPFLIELRNYVLQKVPDFVSYIVHNSRDVYDFTIKAESLVNVLKQEGQSRALVLFDGLDEVFDPDERKRVIDQFQSFAHRYPKALIVVTSRIVGYKPQALGLAGFEHYTLLPLTLGQIRHFADQWYKYYTLEGTERTAQGLVQRIIENPRLLDLAGNPLLLTMMAVIYKDRDLPNERWRLYERSAETLLEDWDLSKGIEDEDFKLDVLIRTAQKSEILQLVSMYMLEHGQKGRELNAIAYEPLLDIVASYLESKYQRPRGEAEAVAVDILRHLRERTYVLAGIGERIFGFVHRTFMEYFAACCCKALFNSRRSDFAWLTRDIFGEHWERGDWEEVLLLLIAMLHDQGTPIREIVEYIRSECRTEIPFNLAFAARCLGEAGDLQDPSQGQELLTDLALTIAEYVPQIKKQSNRTFVESALNAFAVLAPLVAEHATVQETIDRIDQVGTLQACMIAWQMGFALRSRKERLKYALDALEEQEEVVRRGAIAALEREWPGRYDIGQVLAQVVKNDRLARVRQAALAALQRSWCYEQATLDAIASRIEEQTSYTLVIRLIEYLCENWRGNPKAMNIIIKLAEYKPKASMDYDYEQVYRSAFNALEIGWKYEQATLDAIASRIKEQTSYTLVIRLIEYLCENWRGNPKAMNIIIKLAEYKPKASMDYDYEQVYRSAFNALEIGWSKDLKTFVYLRRQAESIRNPKIRKKVLWAMNRVWWEDM